MGQGSGVMAQGSRITGKNPHDHGFTLVELAVVIVILGVMLSLVIPRLGELGEANLKRSARHLSGMIRHLRDEAQARKAVYRLRFDVAGGRYWVESLVQTGDQAGEFKRVYTDMAGEGSLSGETSFRDVRAGSHPDDPYIQFTPDGWVERTLIHLADGDNKPFTLMVMPLTGGAELREGYLEER